MGLAKSPNGEGCYSSENHVGNWEWKKISIRNDRWLKKGLLGGLTTRNEPVKVAELIDIEEG